MWLLLFFLILILMNLMGLRPTEEHELTTDNVTIVMILDHIVRAALRFCLYGRFCAVDIPFCFYSVFCFDIFCICSSREDCVHPSLGSSVVYVWGLFSIILRLTVTFLYRVILTSAVHILSLVFPITAISLFPAMFVSFSAPLNLEYYKMFAILSILYVFLLAQNSRISSTTTISIIKTMSDLSALWPQTNISFFF